MVDSKTHAKTPDYIKDKDSENFTIFVVAQIPVLIKRIELIISLFNFLIIESQHYFRFHFLLYSRILFKPNSPMLKFTKMDFFNILSKNFASPPVITTFKFL